MIITEQLLNEWEIQLIQGDDWKVYALINEVRRLRNELASKDVPV